jgi:hypothetical protein
MVKEPSYPTIDIENLDLYYEDCVIGGPGAFMMTIKDREKFQEAIRTPIALGPQQRPVDRNSGSRAGRALFSRGPDPSRNSSLSTRRWHPGGAR